MRRHFSQNARIGILLVYLFILVLLNALILKEPVPTGLWFWSAFLALFLSEFISQPYFTAPKDAVSNSVTAIIAIVSLHEVVASENSLRLHNSMLIWGILLTWAVVILLLGISAMILGNSTRRRLSLLAEGFTRVTAQFGSPKGLFTGVYLLSLFTFRDQVLGEMLTLSFIWVTVVFGQPIERAVVLFQRIRGLWSEAAQDSHSIGPVVLRREPGLLTIHVSRESFPDIGQLVLIPTNGSQGELGVVLDNYRLSDQRWTRALILADCVPKSDVENGWQKENTAFCCNLKADRETWLEIDIWQNKDNLIGAVIERSDIQIVQIELYRDRSDLFEGRLLSIDIDGQAVLYQITDGITDSELLRQSDMHGFMSIRARKLGCWDDRAKRLNSIPWTPDIYTPVFLAPTPEYSVFRKEFIGVIPQTDYGIQADVAKLVTHNTAILGVLGSGKTSLALELIYRMIRAGVKIFVIDITKEYRPALSQFVPSDVQEQWLERTKNSLNYAQMQSGIRECIEGLKGSSKSAFVLDPNDLRTGMRHTQVTRLVAEQMLEVFNGEMSDHARMCLVLEEAHSLVPEWNSASHKDDPNAVNGTSKAIMQGRKYGFGCLIITQRTANVTKSILNQCNTVFGLRVFDDTGKEFLSNYYGEHYAKLLSELPTQHCIAYGTALNAQTPLIIRLNNKNQFREGFSVRESSNVYSVCQNEDTLDEPHGSPGDIDDIPF